jgi:hypothetical protein
MGGGVMDIADLQAVLRQRAGERSGHLAEAPKDAATSLMLDAARLVEIYQQVTAEQSRGAHNDPPTRQRVGIVLARALLQILRLADETATDLRHAAQEELLRSVLDKQTPSKEELERPSPASGPTTHVLLDYENVQPSEDELRTLVPEATSVWVFHGPHQKNIEQRFASYGDGMTAVPISKTGKNALDFHLSFYMGYIASRNQAASIVVVANDTGYQPMLEHAKAMGFAVRQHGHMRTAPAPLRPAQPAAAAPGVLTKKAASKKSVAKNAPAEKAPPVAKRVAAKKAPAKKVAAKKAKPPAAKKTSAAKTASKARKVATPLAGGSSGVISPAILRKMVESLRKMGDKRPVKVASLQRALKPLLGAATSDEAIATAFNNLIATGAVVIGPTGNATYPQFA